MKSGKWNIIVYLHAVLLLWALLFFGSLFIPDGGKAASILAVGNFLFLFVNIPFAFFSLVMNARNRFSEQCQCSLVILSVLNIIVGVIAWGFAVLLLRKP